MDAWRRELQSAEDLRRRSGARPHGAVHLLHVLRVRSLARKQQHARGAVGGGSRRLARGGEGQHGGRRLGLLQARHHRRLVAADRNWRGDAQAEEGRTNQ